MSGWSEDGLRQARDKMSDAGVDPVAVEVFTRYYRMLESGETGMIPEDSIEPLDMPALVDAEVDDATERDALAGTAVIKLNGGLGTSMGMTRAKSLLSVGRGLSFLDIIVRQTLALRRQSGASLPLVFLNSFSTSSDTLTALGRYDELTVPGVPMELLQNKEPKLLEDTLAPVRWTKDPELEWCPPGHADLYAALASSGLLDTFAERGITQVFVSNSDNLGAVPTAHVAGWFAQSGAPFAIEAARRTPSDRKGGHFARRKADGRIVLRESAQTLPEDLESLADLDRHRFCSTNNLWFDVAAMRAELDRTGGILELPMIRNEKTVDPADPGSPRVIQIEAAMGSAIEVFDGATTIEVDRERFVPVKTTNDLLVLRSDAYRLGEGYAVEQVADPVPFVDLGPAYKVIAEFDRRFQDGPPSLKEATALRVPGDWTFGQGVRIVGDVTVEGDHGKVPSGTLLSGSAGS